MNKMDNKKVAEELLKMAKDLAGDDRSKEEGVKAKSKYPELDKLAKKIGKDVATQINKETSRVKSEMPYKAQYVLEELIEILQKLV